MTKTEIKKIQARHSFTPRSINRARSLLRFLTSEYAKATDSQAQSGLRIRVNELSAIASVLNIELDKISPDRFESDMIRLHTITEKNGGKWAECSEGKVTYVDYTDSEGNRYVATFNYKGQKIAQKQVA